MSPVSDAGSPTFEEPDFSKLGPESEEEDVFDDGDVEDLSADEQDDFEDLSDEDEDEDEDDVNVVEKAGAAQAVLEFVAKSIVDEDESVVVETRDVRNQTRYYLHVAPSDMGRIIGRRGRTAQAVRTLVRAAAAGEGRDVFVEIVD